MFLRLSGAVRAGVGAVARGQPPIRLGSAVPQFPGPDIRPPPRPLTPYLSPVCPLQSPALRPTHSLRDRSVSVGVQAQRQTRACLREHWTGRGQVGDPAFLTVPGPNPLSARPPLLPRRTFSGYASAPFTWDFVSHPLTFLSDSFFKMQSSVTYSRKFPWIASPFAPAPWAERHSSSLPRALCPQCLGWNDLCFLGS